MKLRFHTTPLDMYWSLVHRVLGSRGSLLVQLAILMWATYGTAQKTLHSGANVLIKFLTVVFAAIIWAAFLLTLTMIVSACMTFFARKEGLACEHTLHLRDEGLEEETEVNRSMQRYSMIKGMKKVWGRWMIFGPNGVAFVFRPSRVLEGDAVAFASALNEKKRSDG